MKSDYRVSCHSLSPPLAPSPVTPPVWPALVAALYLALRLGWDEGKVYWGSHTHHLSGTPDAEPSTTCPPPPPLSHHRPLREQLSWAPPRVTFLCPLFCLPSASCLPPCPLFLLNPKPYSHHVGPGHFISRLLYRSPPPIPDFPKHRTQVHSQAQMGTHRDTHADSQGCSHVHTDLHRYTHTQSPEHTWMDMICIQEET